MPNHRQNGRASRHRRSHRSPVHRHQRTHRHPRTPLTWRGRLAALGALAIAMGGGITAGHRLLGSAGAGTGLAVVAADRRSQPQAASRDLNRLAGTATPRAAGTGAPGMESAATVRPSTAPSPSPSPIPSPAAPAPVPTTRKATAAVPAGCSGYGGNQLIACGLLASFGFSLSQMGPLVNLWNGESGWRTNATNPGSGAYGIPQSLPASKMASAGGDWRTNPATQIRWGLGYIKGTYGTPAQAWAAWQSRSPHWY